MFKTIFVFCLFLCAVLAKHELYNGHALFHIRLGTEHRHLIRELEGQLGLDVWSYDTSDSTAHVLVPKTARHAFETALKTDRVGSFIVVVQNIKEKLDLEDQLLAAAAVKSNRSGRFGLSFDTIHTYAEVDAYLVALANRYPSIVTLVSGGRSVEGRNIKYLKISTTNFQDFSKPIVYMQSLLHAREWVTLPATLYAIEKLVIDVQEQDLLQNIDWIILPIANPDGYVWTHTNTRFWRKNRRTGLMVGNVCSGVDLNRNFDFMWSQLSSASACSEDFHGSAVFSEPETGVVRDIVYEHVNRLELFLDIHNFGSRIVFGFGNGQLPSNALIVNLVGVRMAAAIDAVKWPTNRNYVVNNSALLLYPTSGTSSDFTANLGIPLAYTYELPAYGNNNGLNGFLVDPDFIEQASVEA